VGDWVPRADAIEDMRAEIPSGWTGPVFGQVGGGYAVVGQHRVSTISNDSLPSLTAERDVKHLWQAVRRSGSEKLIATEMIFVV
jgi:hypothetical protein